MLVLLNRMAFNHLNTGLDQSLNPHCIGLAVEVSVIAYYKEGYKKRQEIQTNMIIGKGREKYMKKETLL